MRSGCDQPEIRHTTGRFSPFEGDIINEFLGSSAAVVSGGLGFNSRIAVFVFLFLFGFCVFLFLFWSWVLGSNPVQCASWCFVFVVFLIVFFGGFAVVLGCTRTANRPNALRSSLVVLGSTPGSLFWCSCSCLVLRVSLFVLVLGSNPVQCASWCFVFVMFLILVFGGFAAVLGCTRDQAEINLRSG